MAYKKWIVTLALAVPVVPTSTYADYKMYGAGVGSCGEWTSERQGRDWYAKGQWMLGVISAVGYYDVYDLKEVDAQAFAAWVDNYCKSHPLEDFGDAVYALVEELAPKNQ